MQKNIKIFDIQRRIVANRTDKSWSSIPHAGGVVEIDITNLLDMIKDLKKIDILKDYKITLNSVMMKIIAESLKESPKLNGFVHFDRKSTSGHIEIIDKINIGMPTIHEDGRMMTTILRDVGNKTLKEILQNNKTLQEKIKNTDLDMLLFETSYQDTINELKKGRLSALKRLIKAAIGKYRLKLPTRKDKKRYAQISDNKKLIPADLFDATITVTNVGSIMRTLPIKITIAEIIWPQSSLIAIGAYEKKLVVEEDPNSGENKIVIKTMLPLFLAFDHRALDFGDCVGALLKIKELCMNPHSILDDELIEELKSIKEKEKKAQAINADISIAKDQKSARDILGMISDNGLRLTPDLIHLLD